jgi:beta-galactosidase
MSVRPYGARPGILALAVAVTAVTSLPMAHAQSAAPRERISLNSDWRFARSDPPTAAGALAYPKIRTWMMSTGENLVEDADAVSHPRPGGNIGDDVAYTRPDFDDSQWRRLDLPHDWGIEGPFDIRAQSATGKLPYAGIGWYRKHLGIPASGRNKRFSLDIDGAMSYSNVWINGHYAGGWAYGYSSFRVDLSPFILPGADNVLAIRLDNPDQSSRWYPGGGIYRNVWLVATESVHVGHYGTIITTPDVSSSNAEISLGITIDNDSASDAKPTVSIRVFELDADDRKGDNPVAIVDPFPVSVLAGKSTDRKSVV